MGLDGAFLISIRSAIILLDKPLRDHLQDLRLALLRPAQGFFSRPSYLPPN
jgi:hypothetical protein